MYTLAQRFDKKYKLNNTFKNLWSRLLMQDAIEKARKMLTADNESHVMVDSLAEDEDMNETLKRDDFEQIIAELLTRFRLVLD